MTRENNFLLHHVSQWADVIEKSAQQFTISLFVPLKISTPLFDLEQKRAPRVPLSFVFSQSASNFLGNWARCMSSCRRSST